MDPKAIDRLLERIARTESAELSCSECFDMLDTAVEQELSGGAADAPAWRLFRQHLEQCAVCREEYETLRDFLAGERDAPPPPAGT